jgi:hypothetical protein
MENNKKENLEIENNWRLTLSKGPAAAHVYLSINYTNCCQITLDWSFDAVYFKYYDYDWITLSIGPKTITHEIDKIDTDDKLKIFKLLASQFNKLKDYSIISNESLITLKKLLDDLISKVSRI